MISFGEAYAAAIGTGNPDARRCVEALTVADIDTGDCPTFRSVCKRLAPEYEAAKQGALVIAILRAKQPTAIAAWATIIAPAAVKGIDADRRRWATRLYADAYLLLDRWLTNWNRRGIKRVA